MSSNGSAITNKEKERVLQLIRDRPGMSASVLCTHSDMNYKRLLHYIRLLIEDGEVIKKGNMSSSRYYCSEYDPVDPIHSDSDFDKDKSDETTAMYIDVGQIMDSIELLRTIHFTNTDADVHIRDAITELETKLSESLNPCPFCGSSPRIVNSSGQYHIECCCGSLFAYSKSTRSANDTLKAYNRRVVAQS